MTKAFTALTVLKLRDEGRVNLDAPASSTFQSFSLGLSTGDSPRIRVRNLLNHTAGFVSDDPWGDRQRCCRRRILASCCGKGAFARAPGTASEYSTWACAPPSHHLQCVREPFDIIMARTLLEPLDMRLSGFSPSDASMEDRATGYRWQDEAWHVEPLIPHAPLRRWEASTAPPRNMPNGWPSCCPRGRHAMSTTVGPCAGRASENLLRARAFRVADSLCTPQVHPKRSAVSYGMGWCGR